jgi:hypothetical protein
MEPKKMNAYVDFCQLLLFAFAEKRKLLLTNVTVLLS